MNDVHLVVLDPGLTHPMGHHFALAERLVSAFAVTDTDNVALTLCTNTGFEFTNKTERQFDKIQIKPIFTSRFYAFLQEGIADDIQLEILKLAREYVASIRTEYENDAASGVQPVFMFHSLAHVHAMALGLALKELHGVGCRPICLVFAMYHPLLTKHASELRSTLQFSLAWDLLHSLENVSIFASDKEISEAISHYSRTNFQVPIHPALCEEFVCDPERVIHSRVILYAGDAKQDKGYTNLPTLLDDGLLGGNPDVEFVVQYTVATNCQEICTAEVEIKRLAAQYSNLTVISRYLTGLELFTLFSESMGVVFAYDVAAYHAKGSGLLHLAGRAEVPIVLIGESWLAREAQHLGLSCQVIDGPSITRGLTWFRSTQAKPKALQPTTYFNDIYKGFNAWLNQLISSMVERSLVATSKDEQGLIRA